MPQTTKLGLELLQNGAANQTLSNTSFAQLNQLVQAGVTDRLSTPPGSPADEALYIITATATGAWAGRENQLAYWLTTTNAWQYITPREGMWVHVNDEDVYYKYTGAAWSSQPITGMSNPMTTAGDIITGGVSGAPQRLPVGTNGQVLKVVAGAPAWAAESAVASQCIPIACSDETTALTTGTAKVTFRMPFAFTLTAVRASLTTAQASGSIFTVDINESGSSILSTKLTIDNAEKTSTTAATAPVISDSSLADDAEITIDIDQVGNGTATGLKVYLIGVPT